jgi:hypothetical protein
LIGMRKLTLLTAFSLSAAFAASPKLVINSQYLDGHDRVVQVRNDSETTVTAFVVGTSETAITSTDMLLGAHEGHSLRAGETAEVRIPNAGDAEARVFAAIFDNGTTEGDSVSVSRLIQARQEVYGQIRFAMTLLQNENVNNFPSSTVANWFRHWRERWQASDPNRQVPVALACETYFNQAGNEKATRPARELAEVFEELSAKIAASQPGI